ncbi:MAG: hypothetical protein PWR08_1431 [Thermoanaerobacterium sp.]|uniref:Uncharacterized protein n=1 Tax=Thermoanaerobacterium butyriciformans TaxID=1702242 RepID=A0ABS4NGG0_9THEO|nr:hypothetical protein [Thermoanaerobacterium butyriciformans]MDN5317306.1 hypothetical protein [Thermoanaerobacterium sp.]
MNSIVLSFNEDFNDSTIFSIFIDEFCTLIYNVNKLLNLYNQRSGLYADNQFNNKGKIK